MEHNSTKPAHGFIEVDTFDHDDHSSVWVTMHADSLDLEQQTRTLTRDDGVKFKVKEISAYDENGNQIKLKIFFAA